MMEYPINIFNRTRNIVIPIVYNPDTDFSKITNVLLVDSNVKGYSKFLENCSASTFPIKFSQGSNCQDIVDLLATRLPNITRIAIVANDSQMSNSSYNKRLLNNKSYFLDSDLVEDTNSYSDNVQFLIDLIKSHSVKNIDFLACYSLTYDNWKSYYSILTKETGVIVGASNDETGNLKYGGDWTMESTGVDIEATYFTGGISNYQGTLATTNVDWAEIGQSPYGIAIDQAGNVYTVSQNSNNVTKTTPDGISDVFGDTGDTPTVLAIDKAGNVYTANFLSNNVSKITPDGVSTIDWAKTDSNPRGIAIDSVGNVYTTNRASNNVTKITPDGVSTVEWAKTDRDPMGIAIDQAGNVYTANLDSNNVTKITPDGVSTVGWADTEIGPGSIAIDSAGNVYIVSQFSNNITKITPDRIVTVEWAKTDTSPESIAIDSVGNIYTTNYGSNNITKITPGGSSTVDWATTGVGPVAIAIDQAGNIYTTNSGDSTVAKITPSITSSMFGTTGIGPLAIAIDQAGNVYTANADNNTVTKIAPNINTTFGPTGSNPNGIAIDQAGNIYTTNYGSNNVSKITPDGVITVGWATTGVGPQGIAIDSTGNLYTANSLSNNVTKIAPDRTSSVFGTTGQDPNGIVIDQAGNVYTANTESNNVTKITPSGTITTWSTGEGSSPRDIAIDQAGNMYTTNLRSDNVTKITPSGTITTWSTGAGSNQVGIAIDSTGNLYAANATGNNVTKITPAGVITVGWATTGRTPNGIAIDQAGNVYTANYNGSSVTKIAPDSYPAPPDTASAPSAVPLNSAAMVTININSASGRYGAPTSYLVRAVEDNSKSCIIGFTGERSGIITGLVNGQSYTFETVARLGTWNAKASVPSSAVTPFGPVTTTTTLPPIRVTSVKISPTTFTIYTGVTKKIIATIVPLNALNKNVTWKSSNTKIATVNRSGLVKGIAPGNVTIQVKSVDGNYIANSKLKVLKKVSGVKINITKTTIKVKAKKQLKAIIAPSNASNKKVNWKSSNKKIATVSANGLVTGLAPGTVTITCTSVDGSKKAISSITVTK
jgi:DNA-binding beta-propeller fold protein YncE